jgi:hypothetical protein
MKLGHHTALLQHSLRPALSGLGLLWLASACSDGAAQAPQVQELEQGLRGDGRSAFSSTARGHGRRHHWRHHGGNNGGGNNGGGNNGGGNNGGGNNGGGGPVAPCGSFDQDDLFQTISADLAQLDNDDQRFQRYVDLSDRAKEVGCGAALNGDRAALVKLLNSLSINAAIEVAVPVDADETLYRFDLRDYDWDRQVTVGGVTFADAWEAVIANSPYALPYVGDDADDPVNDTGTTVPVLFGSALVAAAARQPLYYALLDIPADVDDFLLNDLAIDVEADRADQETVRAGFVGDVLQGEATFLAERFDIEVRAGYVWQISVFDVGNQVNGLFEDPLANASLERELVFTLPNGMLAHLLADGNGRVVSSSSFLLDVTTPGALASVATSLFASRAQGVQLSDEVRSFVLANPGNFSAAERDAILAVYPAQGQLQQILAADRDGFFARALQLANLDINDTPEPISQSFLSFDADVDLATAAAELFVTPEDLRDNIDLLDPVLAVLDQGRIDRSDFDQLYAGSVCILGVVLENQVDPALCDAVLSP